jgi:hypothetical protein
MTIFLRKSNSHALTDAPLQFARATGVVAGDSSTAKVRTTLHLNSRGLDLSQRIRSRHPAARRVADVPVPANRYAIDAWVDAQQR